MILAGCIEDRERPAPPRLSFTFDRTTVRSINPPAPQDSISGSIQARDPDGIDSVWIKVDQIEAGDDGGLDPSFNRRFSFTGQAGKTPRTPIPGCVRPPGFAGVVGQRESYGGRLPGPAAWGD